MKLRLFLFLFCVCIGSYLCFSHQDSIKVSKYQNYIDPNKPMVAITYDDGPHSKVTNEILDILHEHDARATFFVLGGRISDMHQIIEKMVEMDMEIGNHTYGHKDLLKLSNNEVIQQFEATNDVLLQFINNENLPVVARTPFGNSNEAVNKLIPYPIIYWSIDTKDWSTRNVEHTVNEVMSQVEDGDIILMHDMYEETAQATKKLVEKLLEANYQLVTISEMFNAKNITLEKGIVYKNAKEK